MDEYGLARMWLMADVSGRPVRDMPRLSSMDGVKVPGLGQQRDDAWKAVPKMR